MSYMFCCYIKIYRRFISYNTSTLFDYIIIFKELLPSLHFYSVYINFRTCQCLNELLMGFPCHAPGPFTLTSITTVRHQLNNYKNMCTRPAFLSTNWAYKRVSPGFEVLKFSSLKRKHKFCCRGSFGITDFFFKLFLTWWESESVLDIFCKIQIKTSGYQ